MLCYYCGSNKHKLSDCTKKKLAEKDGAGDIIFFIFILLYKLKLIFFL